MYINIAYIIKPFGINGGLYCEVLTDFPDKISNKKEIYIKNKAEYISINVKSFRIHKKGIVIECDEILSRSEADKYRGNYIVIPQEQVEQTEDNYIFELLNYEVYNRTEKIGTISDFIFNGIQNIMSITDKNNNEILIPFIEQFVECVDNKNKIVSVELPSNYLDIYRTKK